jgi:hypothetical protein
MASSLVDSCTSSSYAGGLYIVTNSNDIDSVCIYDVVKTYAAIEYDSRNRQSNLTHSTFYNCTAGDLICVWSNAIDIDIVNVVSNSPTSTKPNLFCFEDGAALSNIYIAWNEHTGLGATIASGATFYMNSFAAETERFYIL